MIPRCKHEPAGGSFSDQREIEKIDMFILT